MDSIPSLLGLALRAGRLAVGEEPVGAACRGHKAYLLLLASDAADNTIRRASHFSQSAKNTICLQLPLTKAELGSGLGRTACAMAALTDVGFAAAVAQRLAQSDPAAYGPGEETPGPKAFPPQGQGEAEIIPIVPSRIGLPVRREKSKQAALPAFPGRAVTEVALFEF